MTRCSQTHQGAAGLKTHPYPETLLYKNPSFLSHNSVFLVTWNVRTLWETGKCAQAAREMQRSNLTLMGMCEVRWTGHGETLLYSGKNEERHEAGVGVLLSKKAANSLLEWNPMSDRIITARFESRFKKVPIIMCYAPTNTSEEENKNSFYAQLQSVLDKIPNRDMLILMGDMNAKVGADNTARKREIGRHGLREMNENGEMLADFCSTNSLVIGGTIFSHRKCHKATWVFSDKLTENQIDHVMVRQRYRSSLQNVRVRRGADIG